MDLTLNEILLGIIAIAISVIAIKITFSFNLNEYFKSRDEKLRGRIKNHCTHANLKNVGGKYGIISTFISPSGTLNWICQKCSLQVYHLDKDDENQRLESYLNNLDKYKKQEKRFQKLIKKAGLL